MKLFGSLITTGIIIGLVWTTALAQPNAEILVAEGTQSKVTASAKNAVSHVNSVIEKQLSKASSADIQDAKVTYTNERKAETIKLVGLTERQAISLVPSLWQRFQSTLSIQQHLKRNPKKVYVVYQNFSADYQTADITIGYDIKEFGGKHQPVNVQYTPHEVLLNKGRYGEFELAQAWQNIDYRRPVSKVIEIHHLSNSKPDSAEVFVIYGSE
ncbi:hypothetical protein ACFSJY_07740 [Thalassotalea euphylliae]|uniref:hypothetical protein n=1 Tax=Thalassotalea euphylliae TaxID=1655234 RepID=UPI003640B72C